MKRYTQNSILMLLWLITAQTADTKWFEVIALIATVYFGLGAVLRLITNE